MKLPLKNSKTFVSNRVLYEIKKQQQKKNIKINNALMCTSLYLQSMDVHV